MVARVIRDVGFVFRLSSMLFFSLSDQLRHEITKSEIQLVSQPFAHHVAPRMNAYTNIYTYTLYKHTYILAYCLLFPLHEISLWKVFAACVWITLVLLLWLAVVFRWFFVCFFFTERFVRARVYVHRIFNTSLLIFI